ncbi:MAG: thiopurine S-methyltransferase [Planctomycetes bacterium]|nr:thiopurine S-methyltransferase [Planctomycetota bacterium]
MTENWIQRWDEGRTGWHQPHGSTGLQRYWQARGRRVLVPLCGKSLDLRWLAERGHDVQGVELADRAIRDFFAEQGLEPTRRDGAMPAYVTTRPAITLHCGDYFAFRTEPADAHYDRAALAALPPEIRPRYAAHTDSLLRPGPERLVITFEYDQTLVAGPPFAVPAAEVLGYWPRLERIDEREAIAEAPPKFHAAGVRSVTEVIWRSA